MSAKCLMPPQLVIGPSRSTHLGACVGGMHPLTGADSPARRGRAATKLAASPLACTRCASSALTYHLNVFGMTPRWSANFGPTRCKRAVMDVCCGWPGWLRQKATCHEVGDVGRAADGEVIRPIFCRGMALGRSRRSTGRRRGISPLPNRRKHLLERIWACSLRE